jgi:hypothetical protein
VNEKTSWGWVSTKAIIEHNCLDHHFGSFRVYFYCIAKFCAATPVGYRQASSPTQQMSQSVSLTVVISFLELLLGEDE